MTLQTKFYHVTQIILQMLSCNESLVTLAFLWQELSETQFYKDLTTKKKKNWQKTPLYLWGGFGSSSII